MERNEDLSRRETRSFQGLGQNIFKIDFAKLFPDVYGSMQLENGQPSEREVP